MYTTEVAPGAGVNLFGTQLRNPGGSKHSNRPHFTTLKALQVANSAQYSFNAGSTDNRREHVGYGFPDLRKMYDNRAKMFIVDEADVVQQGSVTRWDITVLPGEPELRIALNWADVSANPSSTQHLVNDLSLSATAPVGTVYWGNNGLEQGNNSVAGGTEDNVNSLEVIVIPNPAPGVWHIDVKATSIVADTHVETPQMDADYGLVVSGGTGQGGGVVIIASFNEFGQGCLGSPSVFDYCSSLTPNGAPLTGLTRTDEIAYLVPGNGLTQLLNFEVYTRSTTGSPVTVPAHIYLPGTSGPALTPIASTTLTVGTTPGFYRATFATPVPVGSLYYLGVDSSSTDIVMSQVLGANGGAYFFRPTPGSGSWGVSAIAASWRVTCANSTTFFPPNLDNVGRPTLGGSYDVTVTDGLPSSLAIMATGFSDSNWSGGALPFPLAGAPGCNLLVSPDVTSFLVTDGTGAAQATFGVPNDPVFSGVELFHQWLVLDAVNTLGIVVSEGGRARVGV